MGGCEIYLGVFGLWGWERRGDSGLVVEESSDVFEHREDCVEDAVRRGCAPASRLPIERPLLVESGHV